MTALLYKPATAPYPVKGFSISNYTTFGHQNQTSYGGYRHYHQTYSNPSAYDRHYLPVYGESLGGDKFFTIDLEHTSSYDHYTMTLRTHTSAPSTGICTYSNDFTFLSVKQRVTPRALVRYDDTHYILYATSLLSGVSQVHTFFMTYNNDDTWHIVAEQKAAVWTSATEEYNLATGVVVKTASDNRYVRIKTSGWTTSYPGDSSGTQDQQYGTAEIVSINWTTGIDSVAAIHALTIKNTVVPANRDMKLECYVTLADTDLLAIGMYFTESYRSPEYLTEKGSRVKNQVLDVSSGTFVQVDTKDHYFHSHMTTEETIIDNSWLDSGFPTDDPIYAFSHIYAEDCADAKVAMLPSGHTVKISGGSIVYGTPTKVLAHPDQNDRYIQLGGGRTPNHRTWYETGASVFDGQRVMAYSRVAAPRDSEIGYMSPVFYTGAGNSWRFGNTPVHIITDSGWGYVFWNWYYAPNWVANYSNQATHLLRYRPWLPEGNTVTIT